MPEEVIPRRKIGDRVYVHEPRSVVLPLCAYGGVQWQPKLHSIALHAKEGCTIIDVLPCGCYLLKDAVTNKLAPAYYHPTWCHDSPQTAEKLYVDRYPHKCPHCGSPAYIGFTNVECSKCT